MRNFRPVFRCDEDGGEADWEVAPLQTRAPWLPSTLDTEREGGEAALTLEVNTQPFKQCSSLSLVEECRGLTLIGREVHSVAPPALLGHKEPARASN